VKNKLVVGAAGLFLAVGVAACGSSGPVHNASYQDGFKMGKESKWYGSDMCKTISTNPMLTGSDSASWLQGCEDGLKQATK
jgi:hypothetical protein